mgnify:FL=1
MYDQYFWGFAIFEFFVAILAFWHIDNKINEKRKKEYYIIWREGYTQCMKDNGYEDNPNC